MTKEKSTFEVLNAINVNEHTEKKNGLTYLSWAWAWAEIKKAFPEAKYTVYENADGLFYHTDGKTAWVKTGVTIGDLEYIEYLPVMDYRNKSIPIESITSSDVNKAVQRSLTKACARHGLGLYIYAGEDLPDDESTSGGKASTNSNKASTNKQDERAAIKDKVLALAREKGYSAKEIANRYSIDNSTSAERLQQVLDEMQNLEERSA